MVRKLLGTWSTRFGAWDCFQIWQHLLRIPREGFRCRLTRKYLHLFLIAISISMDKIR